MANSDFISVEAYLQGDYREYEADVDYLDGRIQERNTGTKDHSKWQQAIMLWFARHEQAWNIISLSTLRIRINRVRYRVADVAILDRNAPEEQIPSHPPLAVFEVLSPEDQPADVWMRLADYGIMGVPEVWLVNPANGSFERFERGNFTRQERFSLASHSIDFAVSDIAKLLPDRQQL